MSGAQNDPVLPLDESGQFIRTSMVGNKQSTGKTVLPVVYVILDLDSVPEELTLENAQAAALASCSVIPQETDYAAALEAAPDGRELVPGIDQLLEAMAG